MNKIAKNVELRQVAHTEIAIRAHELFLKRGGRHGFDMEDWLKAETELLHLKALTPSSPAEVTKPLSTRKATKPKTNKTARPRRLVLA